MKGINIITPVKDSIEYTLETIKAIMNSCIDVPFTYTVYNDFSSDENTKILEDASKDLGFELVNLADLTTNPSPNYLMVLRMAQERAIGEERGLLIVESDVLVKPTTLQDLYNGAKSYDKCGIAASVTVDEKGEANYPYEFAKNKLNKVFKTKKHCSFCCSLLTLKLLKSYDFKTLDDTKSWFDVTISRNSRKSGFENYLFTSLAVWHRPHGSRPWKYLKYSNPWKYYWVKLTHGLDKI